MVGLGWTKRYISTFNLLQTGLDGSLLFNGSHSYCEIGDVQNQLQTWCCEVSYVDTVFISDRWNKWWNIQGCEVNLIYTLPETNIFSLKMHGWKDNISFWGPAHFQVLTDGRGCSLEPSEILTCKMGRFFGWRFSIPQPPQNKKLCLEKSTKRVYPSTSRCKKTWGFSKLPVLGPWPLIQGASWWRNRPLQVVVLGFRRSLHVDRHVDPSQDWVRLTCLKPDAPGRGNHKKLLVVGGNLFFFKLGWVIYIYHFMLVHQLCKTLGEVRVESYVANKAMKWKHKMEVRVKMDDTATKTF